MATQASERSPGMPSPAPAEVCGYAIDHVLASPPDAPPSYLAIGPGGRGIVLKPLDPECLYKSGLHPSIRDRLARIRELALAGMANLYGVERDAAGPDDASANGNGNGAAAEPRQAWLVWEYVHGQSFDAYAADPALTPRELAGMARELILTVESLHMQGIVHGALKGGNVIVCPDAGIRLTHASPLLYTDPAEDARAAVELLHEAVRRRKEEGTLLGRLLSEFLDASWTDTAAALRRLGSRLSTLSEPSDPRQPPVPRYPRADPGPRRRALAGAAAVTLLALAAAYGIWQAVGRPSIALPKAVQDVIDRR